MADIEVEGLKELEAKLLDLGAQTGFKTLRTAGRNAMKPVAASAAAGAQVDSGDLRDSIGIRARKGKGQTAVNIEVGPVKKKGAKKDGGRKFSGVDQKAMAQEYGTSKQKANPFLRPALEGNASRVLADFKAALTVAIDKAARKQGTK